MVVFELAPHIICDPVSAVVVVVGAAAAIIALGLLRWSQRRPLLWGPGRLRDKDHNFKFITVAPVGAPAGRGDATAEIKRTYLTSFLFFNDVGPFYSSGKNIIRILMMCLDEKKGLLVFFQGRNQNVWTGGPQAQRYLNTPTN